MSLLLWPMPSKKTIRVVTSHDGDCYEVVVEANNQQGAPILLGHLSENHYVSLEPEADKTTRAEGNPADSIALFNRKKASLYVIYQK